LDEVVEDEEEEEDVEVVEDEEEEEDVEVVEDEEEEEDVEVVLDASGWLVEVCEELELRTKYPPTAATMIITTTAATIVVLIAFRSPRGTTIANLDGDALRPNLI